MQMKGMALGPVQTNCYWLLDDEQRTAMVVDPGLDPAPVLGALAGYRITRILLTHGHWDHVAGVAEVQRQSGAEVWISEIEREWLTDPRLNRSGFWPDMFPTPISGPAPDRLLRPDDTFAFAGHAFAIRHVPGHTPGSLAFLVGNLCLAGDTLFKAGIGRTDLPGGSTAQLMTAIRSQLLTLPDDTVVAPGHGPTTSVGWEKEHNPFVGARAMREVND